MPQSESEQLAAFLAKTVASQVIGAAAAELIANPLLSALNISDTSQQKFQADVLAQLDRIRDQLAQVQASLSRINTAVEALQASINAYAISASLSGYYKTANQIHSRYRFFVDGVAALTKPTGDHAKALIDIYVRLSPPSDATISDAMDDIHSFVVPNAGVQGLFDLILTGMRDAMTAWAQDGKNYKITLGEHADFWIPTDGGAFATRRMLTGGFEVARRYLSDFAVPLMKHVLATEVKGLMLLTRAWAGGLHDDQIKEYVDNVLLHVARMKTFFADRAVPAARQMSATNLSNHGKRLVGEAVKRANWYQLPEGRTGPDRTLDRVGPFLCNDDWVMWEQFPDFSYHFISNFPLPPREDEWKWGREVVMLHRPWEGGVRSAHVMGWSKGSNTVAAERINQKWEVLPKVGDYYTILAPPDFMKQKKVVDFLSPRVGEIALDSDGKVGVKVDVFSDTPPAALADMLKNLPTKREELKA